MPKKIDYILAKNKFHLHLHLGMGRILSPRKLGAVLGYRVEYYA
ncbi:MAG: hypothetical protein WBB60_17385 [Nitrospira sp.]|nr:hypothetical protein [Nitrospira sp.]HRA96719.1 hypothetical protein [Nitrospira sp.]